MASIETVQCYCCGLTEECTRPYIDRVRECYHGRWICGLCVEAVKEETLKSQRDITTDEALKRHMKFRALSSSPPNKPALDLILAVKHLFFRSFDSPRKEGFSFGRSRSCFSSTVNGGTTTTTQAVKEGETS